MKHTQDMGGEHNGKGEPYAAPVSLGLIHIIANVGKKGCETSETEQEDDERGERCGKEGEAEKGNGQRKGETQTPFR